MAEQEQPESTKKPLGRPTKFTPETIDRLLNALRAGSYLNAAAAYAGITPETFYQWYKRGRESKSGRLKDFSDAVLKALADAEMGAILTIHSAYRGAKLPDGTNLPGDWKAAIKFLERRYPHRWAPQRVTTLQGPGGGPVQHNVQGGLVIQVVDSDTTDKDGNKVVRNEAVSTQHGQPGIPDGRGAAGQPVTGDLEDPQGIEAAVGNDVEALLRHEAGLEE